MGDVNIELLQAIMQRVMDVQSQMTREFQDMRARMSTLEHAMHSVRRDGVLESEARGVVQSQVDHLDVRLRRVERRLEIADAP